MSEPDLAPLVLTGKNAFLSESEMPTEVIVNVDKLQSKLPELPMQTRSRLNTQYGIIFIYSLRVISVPFCIDC